MKKKTVSILLMAAMALSLAACGFSNSTDSSSKSSSKAESTSASSASSEAESASSAKSTAELKMNHRLGKTERTTQC